MSERIRERLATARGAHDNVQTDRSADMKLWKLTPRHDSIWWCVEGKDPWEPHHDKAFGFVVRAGSEEEARWLAHESGGLENERLPNVRPWLDEQYSTCLELPAEGRREVVLVNFRHA